MLQYTLDTIPHVHVECEFHLFREPEVRFVEDSVMFLGERQIPRGTTFHQRRPSCLLWVITRMCRLPNMTLWRKCLPFAIILS